MFGIQKDEEQRLIEEKKRRNSEKERLDQETKEREVRIKKYHVTYRVTMTQLNARVHCLCSICDPRRFKFCLIFVKETG